MNNTRLPPVHPGEVLLEEFLRPRKITQYRLAKDIAVPPRRINEIVHGLRAISADTALRLGRYFGNAPQFWLNLQAHHDLERARDDLDNTVFAQIPCVAEPRAHYGTQPPSKSR